MKRAYGACTKAKERYSLIDFCIIPMLDKFLKGSCEEVSVFVFDTKNGSETQLEIAKAAVKRLKTLRHPSILTYLDSYDSDKILYLATEYVEPLASHLEKLTIEGAQKDLYIAWGIFQITVIIII